MHTYLLYVLGSAMGLKAACTMQRVLVYTREHHEHKVFFALARWERQEGRGGGGEVPDLGVDMENPIQSPVAYCTIYSVYLGICFRYFCD